jgi:CRP/FNR family transcriptional regulator, cyclic AMP receptor protein
MTGGGGGEPGHGLEVDRHEFLALLSLAEIDELRRRGRRRHWPRGASLFSEGARSDVVIILLTGRVKVYSLTELGGEVVLAVRGPGALLGDLAAIDGRPRSASVSALEPVDALVLTAPAFTDYLESNARVTLVLLRMLTGRLRDADRKRVEFGAHDTAGRVARRLVELAERFGEPAGRGGVRITVPFTQDELASWVGSSREAVTKSLSRLRARGYIQTQRRTITVLDLEALRRV